MRSLSPSRFLSSLLRVTFRTRPRSVIRFPLRVSHPFLASSGMDKLHLMGRSRERSARTVQLAFQPLLLVATSARGRSDGRRITRWATRKPTNCIPLRALRGSSIRPAACAGRTNGETGGRSSQPHTTRLQKPGASRSRIPKLRARRLANPMGSRSR